MEKIRLSETLELSRVVMGCMRLADSQITGEDLLEAGGNLSGHGCDLD